MLNEYLYEFFLIIEAQPYSQMLVSSYYLWNWTEATHVLSLMLCLGSLFIIDLRMLGLILTQVPASNLADRLHKPMMLGFLIMFITGFLLVYAKPVEVVTSLWFRLKMLFLVLAFINAWIFNTRLKAAKSSWDNSPAAPRALRIGAIISLLVWCCVVVLGRYIPYDWITCTNTDNSLLLWASGCVDQLRNL
ncbi:MAG: hypothetical protein COC19_05540 [SAR86 cluster bacterium]|uniref:DUF6644 domain-containing protein n=1 Tax=SAR86 cluster bacterium TaxID=2030880 RepID=A0A2A4MLK8_9GAMM|nr:MAG: hypothetical protein COC19_05540 [SAR86 cluster bacterium]